MHMKTRPDLLYRRHMSRFRGQLSVGFGISEGVGSAVCADGDGFCVTITWLFVGCGVSSPAGLSLPLHAENVNAAKTQSIKGAILFNIFFSSFHVCFIFVKCFYMCLHKTVNNLIKA